ncbi:MAG: hypothetical protein WKF89_01980 [Chitinophagaceae bacterium]
MENDYKKFLGKEVSFHERSYVMNIGAWNKFIVPAIEALKHSYYALGIGNFNQSIFDQLLTSDGIKQVALKAEEQFNSEISRTMKLYDLAQKTALLNGLPDKIATIGNRQQELKTAIKQAEEYGYGDGTTIHLDSTSFAISGNGEAVLDDKKIRKACSTYITTERQAKLYEKQIGIINAYKELVDLFKSEGIRVPGDVWFTIFHQENDGTMKLREGAEFFMDSLIAFKKREDELGRQQQEATDKVRKERERITAGITHDLNGKLYPTKENEHLFNQKAL